MNYCKTCVQPDTRPGIFLNQEGICSGCLGDLEKNSRIDWEARRKELHGICDQLRSSASHDCIVPVSGGKDSTYQIHMLKNELGMNPLAVTYRYADRTPLGQENLDNLLAMGVDHVEMAPSPRVEKAFIKKALIQAGDPCLPDHMGIFSVALRAAVSFKIPLIVWGESPQLEYGGSFTDRNNPYLDNAWLKKHGCLQGKGAEDWIDEDLSAKDMAFFQFPSDRDLEEAKIKSIFLGYYLRWDPVENFQVARNLGFKKHPQGPRLGLYDFADLDSTNIVVHHYIKWLKFGMTRMHDNISVEIRNKRMTRDQGIKILKEQPERLPEEEIDMLCRYLDLSQKEFWDILETFRNQDIWKKDQDNNWHIPDLWEGLE